jgi:hypothetical protein
VTERAKFGSGFHDGTPNVVGIVKGPLERNRGGIRASELSTENMVDACSGNWFQAMKEFAVT